MPKLPDLSADERLDGAVESAPGIEDERKMEAFMREVQRAQAA